MKIKIKNNSDWVEGEKKILYEIYYNMVDGYYDDDVKEKEILNKLLALFLFKKYLQLFKR